MNNRGRAVQLLALAGYRYNPARHGQRLARLVGVLNEHPDARVESCSDERTGVRYGNAVCRKGRCARIGGTAFRYQLWAVWTDGGAR